MEKANEARQGLTEVHRGEGQTIAGWLRYGAALNKGREMFPSDEQFGQWLVCSKLEQTVHRADRAAAMWVAKDLDAFNETEKLHPRVRTVRGLHAKWKEAQRPTPKT